MPQYEVELDALDNMKLDAMSTDDFFSLAFPKRHIEIEGNGKLVTKKHMERYIDYFLLSVKHLSTLEQEILNTHLEQLQQQTGTVIELQEALMKVQEQN